MPRLKINERTLYQRINRRLRHQGEQLRTARSKAVERDAGRYFIVSARMNAITAQDVDLAALGAELGCIRPWEEFDPR